MNLALLLSTVNVFNLPGQKRTDNVKRFSELHTEMPLRALSRLENLFFKTTFDYCNKNRESPFYKNVEDVQNKFCRPHHYTYFLKIDLPMSEESNLTDPYDIRWSCVALKKNCAMFLSTSSKKCRLLPRASAWRRAINFLIVRSQHWQRALQMP